MYYECRRGVCGVSGWRYKEVSKEGLRGSGKEVGGDGFIKKLWKFYSEVYYFVG